MTDKENTSKDIAGGLLGIEARAFFNIIKECADERIASLPDPLAQRHVRDLIEHFQHIEETLIGNEEEQ